MSQRSSVQNPLLKITSMCNSAFLTESSVCPSRECFKRPRKHAVSQAVQKVLKIVWQPKIRLFGSAPASLEDEHRQCTSSLRWLYSSLSEAVCCSPDTCGTGSQGTSKIQRCRRTPRSPIIALYGRVAPIPSTLPSLATQCNVFSCWNSPIYLSCTEKSSCHLLLQSTATLQHSRLYA